VGEYSLSQAAEEDVRKIYRYSLENFGETKAAAYLLSLDECFLILAGNPDVGKDVSYIRSGYYQFSHDRHAVFYKRDDAGVFIVRVLHAVMEHSKHL